MAASLKVLQERARKMRSAPTGAEHHFVYWLKKLGVKKLSRQVVIGSMIVDMAIPSRNILIEIDGISHVSKRRQDERRTAWLEGCGFRVVRVSNRNVLRDGERTAAYVLSVSADTEENAKAFARAKAVASKARAKNL